MSAQETVCPRCADANIHQITASPVPGAWEVLQCPRCFYMWRTTEPARRSIREHYPEQHRLTEQDIETASEVPTIPPRR